MPDYSLLQVSLGLVWMAALYSVAFPLLESLENWLRRRVDG